MLPFQVGWQQTDDGIAGGVSIKFSKTLHKALPVQMHIRHVMPAVGHSCGAAAFKPLGGKRVTTDHRMVLEKPDGKEGNGFQLVDKLWINTQQVNIFPVQTVVLILVPENLQGKILVVGNVKNGRT